MSDQSFSPISANITVRSLARATWVGLRVSAIPVVACLLWLSVPNGDARRFVVFSLVLVTLYIVIPGQKPTRSAVGWWAVYVVGTAAFVVARTYADELGNPVRYQYPIQFSHALFGGLSLPVWLQHLLPGAAERGPILDGAVAIYVSYFFVPSISGAIIARRSTERLRRYATAIVFTLAIGLLTYAVLPTAPPWLAARDGYLPPVTRLVPAVINPEYYAEAVHHVGTNDVGAMPSLHLALTAVVCLALWSWRRWAGLVGVVYVLAMAFSLMYLGEHYLLDVLAGAGVACLAWGIAGRLTRTHSVAGAATRAHGSRRPRRCPQVRKQTGASSEESAIDAATPPARP